MVPRKCVTHYCFPYNSAIALPVLDMIYIIVKKCLGNFNIRWHTYHLIYNLLTHLTTDTHAHLTFTDVKSTGDQMKVSHNVK